MGQLGIYFSHFKRELGTFFDYFIREGGSLLYIVILLGMLLMIWFVWQKFKIRKVQTGFVKSRDFED